MCVLHSDAKFSVKPLANPPNTQIWKCNSSWACVSLTKPGWVSWLTSGMSRRLQPTRSRVHKIWGLFSHYCEHPLIDQIKSSSKVGPDNSLFSIVTNRSTSDSGNFHFEWNHILSSAWFVCLCYERKWGLMESKLLIPRLIIFSQINQLSIPSIVRWNLWIQNHAERFCKIAARAVLAGAYERFEANGLKILEEIKLCAMHIIWQKLGGKTH